MLLKVAIIVPQDQFHVPKIIGRKKGHNNKYLDPVSFRSSFEILYTHFNLHVKIEIMIPFTVG